MATEYAPTREQLDAYFAQYYSQGSANPGQPQPQADVHPAVKTQLEQLAAQNDWLKTQLGQTQQYLGGRAQQEEKQVWDSAAAELRAFENATEAGQPKYPFMHEVRGDMAKLMSGNFANSLEDAYEKATRLRTDVFQPRQEK